MIRCRDCQKIMVQVYLGCDQNLLATVPEVQEMLKMQEERMEKKIEELKRELKETTVALEDLSDAYQELEAQSEWQKVPNAVNEQTQTERSYPSASSAGEA